MSQKIKIAARLRPRIHDEIDDSGINITHSSDPTIPSTISVTNPRDPSQIFNFPFTSCYDQLSTQEEIFQRDVQPLINVVYSGVTVTIFAYGVTSSGKTHTMQGDKVNPGVIPRVVKAMFQQQSTLQRSNVALAVSYMEIYKDEVYDLLVNRETAPKLPVRENDAGQVFVANLTSLPIQSAQEFDSLYARASKHRSVGSTNLNRASSRSHAVLTITVTMTDSMAQKTLTGKINLVDLAGSENNKLTGNNDPVRLAESAAINKSLSVLGQVVWALNSGASRIPYRNSKLTRILQDALGGSSVGLLICNLAPGVKFRQDTLNTLNFAVRTKNVENRPVVNERDLRPQPKPHFAATRAIPQPAKLAPAVLQPIQIQGTSGLTSGADKHGLGKMRTSLAGAAGAIGDAIGGGGGMVGRSRPSKLPRVSAIGVGGAGYGIGAGLGAANMGAGASPSIVQLTDREIDERIAKAVEAEVARRLKEREDELDREREREREKEEQRRADEEYEKQRSRSQDRRAEEPEKQRDVEHRDKHHKSRDVDDELKTRLQNLEDKFERGVRTVNQTSANAPLSPISRKKMGRAYVSLARTNSEKGNLQAALDLYRVAETYVPDNIKLKERIIEIEWAVRNEKEFVPSPKRIRKPKLKSKKRQGRGHGAKEEPVDGAMTESSSCPADSQLTESSSNQSLNPLKRLKTEAEDESELDRLDDGEVQVPLKKYRGAIDVKVEDQWAPMQMQL
ncbi:P-loop containing nucleoside triphosphate hydrolase protein [Hygrophoropsis aurantiaca]|uniref:P-loop containing nucleoside triphosphate hydrolase protein n=1 Tax=Hygrophoropsis aurantiaca TaxID=72124 RepID=A0ACB8AG73_9AGAM|nr:P-loop containing nucleoside triphosphate hydrolase protein [Hygrophoropsis aurantiaca]